MFKYIYILDIIVYSVFKASVKKKRKNARNANKIINLILIALTL